MSRIRPNDARTRTHTYTLTYTRSAHPNRPTTTPPKSARQPANLGRKHILAVGGADAIRKSQRSAGVQNWSAPLGARSHAPTDDEHTHLPCSARPPRAPVTSANLAFTRTRTPFSLLPICQLRAPSPSPPLPPLSSPHCHCGDSNWPHERRVPHLTVGFVGGGKQTTTLAPTVSSLPPPPPPTDRPTDWPAGRPAERPTTGRRAAVASLTAKDRGGGDQRPTTTTTTTDAAAVFVSVLVGQSSSTHLLPYWSVVVVERRPAAAAAADVPNVVPPRAP